MENKEMQLLQLVELSETFNEKSIENEEVKIKYRDSVETETGRNM